ncbi:polysaccharide biosynthesis C-terminal domain-containing protein [Maribacter sp. PR1]|uniref:Polysaccharide biosynthesis C-terminal domain-containing protein n=1 Tax=Maribacter cobaltidurans TaxID=1178778 RepID=A0ABU7IW29_9FLAO|nr:MULTISPECIES: polysaccharide biosynthesis C-terminal domain-containing protein [Maribacter]MDC6389695.1 polysaccharide biosynthesis C-terminal domain-containing protein [Maribacter sp. PR1]MEE1977085.1 polysaccharide biosynthesis C-terminal domain-containing protein [Maribacter cobaltidurans]
MGIVLKQSLNNTIVTYIGFAIAAVNTFFLYTNFMQPENYGLIQVILSVSGILMPILAFGVPNSLVKFYSSFKSEKDQDSFLSMMLFLPLFLMIPVALISYMANEAIGGLLSKENPIVKDYVWHIFLVGMAMAYFEVFYAWSRIKMKSVFGNFMKEVFCRVGQSILLILLWFKIIDIPLFINALVGFYLLRTIIMKLYAYRLRFPKIVFKLPGNWVNILKYSALIILGGSTAIVLMEVDKVMLNNYLPIENVAYYAVAGFMATVIAVPARAMHQITYPMTAEYINKKDTNSLKGLYQKSSLTLFIVSALILVLILLNLDDLYQLLPSGYEDGFFIVFWIGLAKVYDALLGNNNSILYNSDYYKSILLFGVLLAIMAIGFNLWLIPTYGLNGAAIASFSAFFIYNSIKLFYVKSKFGLQPFTLETIQVCIVILVIALVFYNLIFSFHPFFNIPLKCALITLSYFLVLYKFKISEDVNAVIKKFLKS